MPHISLVVCTRNRASALPTCLAALNRLASDVTFEIVIVDNGSTDHTANVIAEFALTAQVRVVVMHEANRGVSHAKNAGIRVAQGEIIAFTDDDCYPAPDYLNAITQCFQDQSIAYVGGKVLLFDPSDLPITIQPLNHEVAFPTGCYISPGLIHGANFAFRRRVFDVVGGFDTKLGPGTPLTAEDVDMLQRASIAGFSGAYTPFAVVFHHHRRQTKQDEKDILRSYALGRGAYFFKGLSQRESRRLFIWPVLKRVGGHIAYLRFTEFFHELQGALIYWQTRHLP
ncbi:glycosyltransferase family 2 protein [Rhodoferax antarcticus]|uniref:glycosyltransferase family 2 protein n=1 Tax=Rhodoferax antarcticus TaxID=81479 RepID=UPI001301126F|nr:glycosyltransferase family A protein [Rhodoferax antarcticus]